MMLSMASIQHLPLLLPQLQLLPPVLQQLSLLLSVEFKKNWTNFALRWHQKVTETSDVQNHEDMKEKCWPVSRTIKKEEDSCGDVMGSFMTLA